MKNLNFILAITLGSMSPFALASENYIPSLYNFSVMYDFNPIKGKVKELNTHIINKVKDLDYNMKIKLSSDGCIESFERTGKYEFGDIHLVRNGRVLTDTSNNDPINFNLDEHCNIIARTDKYGRSEYKLNEDGYIIESTLNGQPFSAHKFNDNGSLVFGEYFMYGGTISSYEISYSDETSRPFDAEVKSKQLDGGDYYAKSSCEYEDRHIPVRCTSLVKETKDGVVKESENIAYTDVMFY
ncbi:YnfC family lipoprotein [Siccibacter colletis]|uniref:YnfC family lipoprotein n=1 Tax=Siccibacter colletis TaxID=1505757 RepID=UPI0028BF4B9A|nr:YnfC family lipoprotein [Siccibacter colletis]WNN49885.1 YnfC family lipoprotein [Siccibacter colletis]